MSGDGKMALAHGPSHPILLHWLVGSSRSDIVVGTTQDVLDLGPAIWVATRYVDTNTTRFFTG